MPARESRTPLRPAAPRPGEATHTAPPPVDQTATLTGSPAPQLDRPGTLTAGGPATGHAGAPAVAGAIPGYDVGGEIARGGMGLVLAARDRTLDREVAVKVLHPDRAATADAVERFVREAKITARLPHPGVPPVHALGTTADGSPFLAMKLIRGRTLADLLAERPSPAHDLPRLVQTFEQIAQAVAFAHAEGIIHRDLKPANVMVGAFGEVQVMDWGLAKVLADSRAGPDEAGDAGDLPDLPDQTAAGSVMGTPAYMPPEQARGELDRVDRRADVFALGAVLCEVLTGHRPYSGHTSREVLKRAATGDLSETLARLDGCGADAELAGLARWCLGPTPDDRPADAGAVAGLVASYRGGVEARLRAAERDKAAAEAKATEGRKRRKVQLALAAAVLLLATAGGAFAWWDDRQAAARDAEQARVKAEQARTDVERKAELSRVETERRAEREVAAAERRFKEQQARLGVADSLALAATLRTQFRFAEAEAAVEQAAHQAGAGDAAVGRARTDLALVKTLDDIRMKRWEPVQTSRTKFDTAAASPAYLAAFRGHGLGLAAAPDAAVAARVAASPVKAELVAALDDWAMFEPDETLLARILAVARLADPCPWADVLRDPAARRDRGRLEALAREAEDNLPPGNAILLAALMATQGLDPGRILAVTQARHPNDFYVCLAHALWLHERDPGAALGHYRAALAVRPASPIVVTNLGTALLTQGDADAAAAVFRQATRRDPTFALNWYHLGLALRGREDWDEAVDAFQEAIRLSPRMAAAHSGLGVTLVLRAEALTAADPRGFTALGGGLLPGPPAREASAAPGAGRPTARADKARASAAFAAAARLDPAHIRPEK